MSPLEAGSVAPDVPGMPAEGDRAVVFYKVTCPTCQMAAPAMERLSAALGDRFHAVVQDPPDRNEAFAHTYATSFDAVTDDPPYPLSDAYGVRVVPSVFVLRDGEVRDVVESWDRDGWNRAASLLGAGELSHEGDGLPPFRPG